MLWAGRIVSGLVVAFLLFDGAIKLVPLDVVITTSQELGIPAHLARTLGVLTLICTLLYAFPRTAVLGAVLATRRGTVLERGRRHGRALGPPVPPRVSRARGAGLGTGQARGFSRISHVSMRSPSWMSLKEPSPIPHS